MSPLIIIGFIFIREIPAVWFLSVWIAHIGGFVFGLATVLLVAQRRPRAPSSRFPVY